MLYFEQFVLCTCWCILVSAYVQSWSVVNNWAPTFHLNYSEKAPDAVWPLGKKGWVSRCQENSYSSSSEWSEKASRTSSQLLVGHYEERPVISQPQCGRSRQAGPGQATVEVVFGSKWSCALNWCKLNNDDDGDDDDDHVHAACASLLLVYVVCMLFFFMPVIQVQWYWGWPSFHCLSTSRNRWLWWTITCRQFKTCKKSLTKHDVLVIFWKVSLLLL